MKVLFFTNTPAHVHMYKYAVQELSNGDSTVRVLGRDYGCTADLLEYYDLEYKLYGSCGSSKRSLFRELPLHYTQIFRTVRAFDPDLIFGYGAYSAHAGAVARAPVITIFDSEPTHIDHVVSKPFTTVQLTPNTFEKDLGGRHYTFNGFKETAYLHPDNFEPATANIEGELEIERDSPYVVLRFNDFGSHHDFDHSGFTHDEKITLIERLSEYAAVLVSDEGKELALDRLPTRTFDLHPAKMHDVLANAALLVADTQTMVTEAALLGTPAIRSNSFVGDSDMGNFKELESNDLVHNEETLDAVLDRAEGILSKPSAKQQWRRRCDEYLAEKVDLTEVIVDIVTEFGQSREAIPEIVERSEVLS